MSRDTQGYGFWSLVIINSIIFIFFAFSFYKPKTKIDWTVFGTFSAFIVALFFEMYGFPLTIYLLSGWLVKTYPQVDFFSHENGHLLHTIFGFKGDPHFDILHILSILLTIFGFLLLASSWRILYRAHVRKKLATTGPYQYIRHPQYVAFILIMFSFLLQWPTFPTVVMFPMLVALYIWLSLREEVYVQNEFGETYKQYIAKTPRFIPHIKSFFEK